MADRGDARWLDHICWDEVVVAAESAGSAIVTASEALASTGRHVGNESPPERSGFEDEKLYSVTRIGSDDGAPLGAAPRVLRAVRDGIYIDPTAVP